jgi:natural product precursor
MKNIMKKIKLNTLAQNALKEKEMNHVRGVADCWCGCYYQGTPGGSSTSANDSANRAGGLWIPGAVCIGKAPSQ